MNGVGVSFFGFGFFFEVLAVLTWFGGYFEVFVV